MEPINLWVICLNAFVAVLVLLGGLSLFMKGLTALFPPPPEKESDGAIVAAIQSVVHQYWPGARVTRLEEK